MLIVTDRGAVASGEHIGAIAGELLEHDGHIVEVAGPLGNELRAAVQAGGDGLRDVEHGGPACVPTLRDGVVLRWVRGRAVVVQLEGDAEPAAPMPPVDADVIY